jgi:methylamine dehydrogenase heavy chain
MTAIGILKWTLLAALATAPAQGALAQTAPGPRPPPLSAEVSDVAVLPDPVAHRILLLDAFDGGDARLLDGDSGKILGGVSAASLSNIGVGPGQGQIFVAESIWTKGNRGDRLFVLGADG